MSTPRKTPSAGAPIYSVSKSTLSSSKSPKRKRSPTKSPRSPGSSGSSVSSDISYDHVSPTTTKKRYIYVGGFGEMIQRHLSPAGKIITRVTRRNIPWHEISTKAMNHFDNMLRVMRRVGVFSPKIPHTLLMDIGSPIQTSTPPPPRRYPLRAARMRRVTKTPKSPYRTPRK